MQARVRYILPVVVLLIFGGWVYSDDLPKPDLVGAVQNLQQTLQQLQTEIKDLQSSVKELAKDAKEAQKQKSARVNAPHAPVVTAAATAAPAAGANIPAPNWQRAQEAFERGRRSEDLKAYGPAIEAFTETIEVDPKNDSAFLHRGYSHYYLGDYTSAVADLTQSLALQPHNSRAYAMRASALSSSGKAAEALADIEQAIQKDSHNPENYLLRASLHQQLGQGREAQDDYAQAIQLSPDSERAYLGRAAVLRTHGKVQESLADCYKAIQLNPSDTAAYLCRAQFYLSTGAAQPALEDINRAMLIGQKPNEAVTLLSEARKMVDAIAQASAPPAPQQAPLQPALVAQAQPLLPQTLPGELPLSPASHAALLGTPQLIVKPLPVSASPVSVKPPQLAQRRMAVPPQVLTSVLNKEPVMLVSKDSRGGHDANRWYRQGRYLSEQQNFEEAEQSFTEAIQLDPTHALALNARGYARLRLRRYQDAIGDCSQAIRLNPAYANAYLNRSVAKRAMGDIAGARDDQRHAMELDGTAQTQATLSKP